MLRYLHGSDLHRYPALGAAMFRHRAAQFRDRLGWAVTVDAAGEERDGYDALDPLYVIWQTREGGHGGSLRLLPTRGPTMLREHFCHLRGAETEDRRVWECSRFCLAPGAGPQVSAALLLGAAEVGLLLGLSHALGVFAPPMLRLYTRLGWMPELLDSAGEGREAVALGRWSFSRAVRDRLAARAGLSRELSAHWLARGFALARDPRTARAA